MGISKTLKLKIMKFNEKDKQKLLKMAIEDKTSHQEIKETFDFTPGEIEKFLLKEIGDKRFKRWKLRQQKRSTSKGKPRLEL
jgi:uncharacterized protein (TIGR03643 family)